MSLLPPDFQFSQRNLQDYVDCRRRFQLRYLQGLVWPAVEVEPHLEHEQRMQSGSAFHRLVQQHLLGVPPERLSAMLGSGSDDLQRWWENYLGYFLDLAIPQDRLVEATLSAGIGAYRLVAKYDLIYWEGDQAGSKVTILDWKTSLRHPPRSWLAERLQTRVYPYLLVNAGASYAGQERIKPDQIEMIYWFAEHPDEPERFAYDSQGYQLDHEYLSGLVHEIEKLTEDEFTLTDDESLCGYCTYRSLCNRGLGAGSLDQIDYEQEDDGEDDFTLDFDHIAEIEF
jgi:hypothetical protein